MVARRRDRAATVRDEAAERRDWAAKLRDEAAEQRDEVAQVFEASAEGGTTTDWLSRSARFRTDAASDRKKASYDRQSAADERGDAELDRKIALADRGSGAGERADAELDRNIALTDRGWGADERTDAELDRTIALADRGASAREREFAGLDDLTGAYLRGTGLTALENEIGRARRTRQPLIVAFVDVDGLKVINDSRGHAAGDRVLVGVAAALRARLRAYDLVIRHGGDEFVVTISGFSVAEARTRFELVNAALAESPDPGSVSIGFAEMQANDLPEELVARADAALYQERGRTRGLSGIETSAVP